MADSTKAWAPERRAALPGVEYNDDEFGRVASLTAAQLVAALGLVKQGKIYDLDCGRWNGMPLMAVHPPFQVITYRSASGMDVVGDMDEWRGANPVHMAVNTEMVMGTTHTGTHLDALYHITCGDDNHAYSGYKNAEALGDFGPTRAEASSIAPIVTRGILVDMTRGTGPLPAGHVVSLDDFLAVVAENGITFQPGDAVLINTGWLTVWTEDSDVTSKHIGAGVSLAIAEYAADHGAVVLGADQGTVEADPSPDLNNPHPVHIEMLVERGIHLLENAYLDDLARDKVTEFLFVCLPLRIRGATGSWVRPVAIV
ncbi:cyclase family protein [Propionicicella superfundia]|uniref:cyclase family protein n=1 Tax=Propionicicella superfundia TaxID=348582 RepID=UPI0004112306|nr:cyclase family protein [Propionicicella superfundia]